MNFTFFFPVKMQLVLLPARVLSNIQHPKIWIQPHKGVESKAGLEWCAHLDNAVNPADT